MQNRRTFLGRSLAVSGGLLVGCAGSDEVDPTPNTGFADAGTGVADAGAMVDAGFPDAGMVPTCDDPFSGGMLERMLGFDGEDGVPLNEPFNVGWDGRLYTDLSMIDRDNMTVSNDVFYIRTRFPDELDTSVPWSIDVDGMATPRSFSLDDLGPLVKPQGNILLECSGNSRGGAFGLLSSAEWAGAPLVDIFGMIDVNAGSTRVEIAGFDGHSVPSNGGHSTPGASWIFTFQQLIDAGAFFATEMNGVPLPPDHGQPVRLMVPGWYGCCNIKWANRMTFVDENASATSQMMEFASRTHQPGRPRNARDYIPATMDQSAMPTRIERWNVNGETMYRILGIMWGGYEVTEGLTIRFNGGAPMPVEVCPIQEQNRTWTIWEYAWQPTTTGLVSIRMEIDDPSIQTRRLDTGYYERSVRI